MKKRIVVTGLFIALAAVAGVFVKREFFFTPGVTVQNFRQLYKGMAPRDIESVLGEVGVPCEPTLWNPAARWLVPCQKRWVGDGITIELLFHTDADEENIGAIWGFCIFADGSKTELGVNEGPLIDRIRRRFGI